MNNDKVKQLFDLIAQNPGLPVIPMVDSEICEDDSYARYMGEIGFSFVGEYAIYDDMVIHDREEFKERYYDNNDEELCEKFGYIPHINKYTFHSGDCTADQLVENEKAEKRLEEYLDGIAEKEFQKAILVNIDIPS